jgi:hypothetical protein
MSPLIGGETVEVDGLPLPQLASPLGHGNALKAFLAVVRALCACADPAAKAAAAIKIRDETIRTFRIEFLSE